MAILAKRIRYFFSVSDDRFESLKFSRASLPHHVKLATYMIVAGYNRAANPGDFAQSTVDKIVSKWRKLLSNFPG